MYTYQHSGQNYPQNHQHLPVFDINTNLLRKPIRYFLYYPLVNTIYY